MAFKLATSNVVAGLENQAAQALLCLKHFHELTPPVTEADMRNELESGQPIGFISNEGWTAFVGVLVNLSLDDASLVASERAIINTLRQVVTPEPQLACCDTVIPADLDGLTSITGNYRTGSTAPYQYEIVVTLDKSLTCAIKSIDCTLVGAPAVTSANPFTMAFKQCNANGDSEFTALWVTWAADPAGNSYDVTYDFKDADGISIVSYAVTDYQLNL